MGRLDALSPAAAPAFALCFFGWALFELAVNLRQWRPGALNRDGGSRWLILAGMLAAFALAAAAARLPWLAWLAWPAALRPGLFWLGLGLMLAGLLFRFVAIRQLGRFFLPEVAIQPGQRVIDCGLYRYLRHPSYTGTFITLVGFGLALGHALSLAVLLLLPGLVYAHRMRLEEAALVEVFGDAYRAYMRRTRRLIPFLF